MGAAGATEPEGTPLEDDCGEAPSVLAEEAIAEIVDDLEAGRIQPAAAVALLSSTITCASMWSGRLPAPDDLAAYPEPVQERILSWEDAFSSDESHRQDLYVAAEIAAERRGSVGSMILFGGCLMLAACAFFFKDSVEGALVFVSLPVLGLIGRFLRPLRASGKRRADNEPR